MNLIACLLPFLASALDATPPDDDGPFSPMLLGALFTLVILGICIVVALIVAVSAAIMLGLGMVSSSALIGLLRQRVSSGLRALHYQVFAVLGIPSGIGLLWCAARLLGPHPSPLLLLAMGSVAGLCTGLLLAFLIDCVATVARRRFISSSKKI